MILMAVKDIFRAFAVFNELGHHVYGTDRESNHAYGDAYEAIIDRTFGSGIVTVPMGYGDRTCLGADPDQRCGRARVKLMMEVGVADGNSLLAWRQVFPNAVIVGLDHNATAFGATVIDRVEFHLGDCRVQRHCEMAAYGRDFDLIVDDASHQIGDIFMALLWLWPFVRPGGLYVIEDLPSQLCHRFASMVGGEVIDTTGPFGGNEPLIVLRKPPR